MYSFIKKAVFLIPFLMFFVLLVLAFYQHPGSDDFTVHYFVETLGLRGAINSYLLHSTGRYISVSLLLWVASSRFFLDHYFLLLQFFMFLTFVNTYFFVRWILSEFLEKNLSIAWRLWITIFFIFILLGSIPQVGSFFFWLSTDLGYLLPFNAFLCYLPALYSIFEKKNPRPVWQWMVLFLLSILMAGSDEISMFYMLMASFSFFAQKVYFRKNMRPDQSILVLLQVALVFVSFLFPGNRERGGGFVIRQAFTYSLVGSLYQTFQVFLSVFSNLFFWIGFLVIFGSYSFLKEEIREKIKGKRTTLYVEMLILLSSAVFLLFFARHIAGVVLPPRAKNLVACYLILGLYAIAFLNSPFFQFKYADLEGWYKTHKVYLLFFLGLLLICNPFTLNLVQSMVMAPVHDRVLNTRVARIREARNRGKDIVHLNPYLLDCRQILEKTYGKKAASYLFSEFPEPVPRLFWFSDDPASKINGLSYNSYYGIDTVLVGRDTSFSWQVAGIGLWGEKK